jgi:hypothetical protein
LFVPCLSNYQFRAYLHYLQITFGHGHGGVFFPLQFCEVGGLVLIHLVGVFSVSVL